MWTAALAILVLTAIAIAGTLPPTPAAASIYGSKPTEPVFAGLFKAQEQVKVPKGGGGIPAPSG